MLEFKSWRDYSKFEKATKGQFRFIHSQEVREFLDTVLQTATKQTEILPKGSFLWRAQLGHDCEPIYEKGEHIYDEPIPFCSKRMKPLHEQAIEGRANPKGIPYLYLATHRDTAIAEVRPWIGSYVSVGQFKMTRELHLVNCTTKQKNIIFLEEPSADQRQESVWKDIDRAFAHPLSPCDDIADYVPTQIIAELFKANNFDGIAYRSSLGDGHNIALFNLDAAELLNCSLFQVDSIKFESHEAGNPYFVQR